VKALAAAFAATALIPVLYATAALVGLGLLRQLPPVQVVLSAAALVVLPVAGLRAALGPGAWSLGASGWVWGGLLVLGLPGYFPGEMKEAVGAGVAVFAAPAGADATARAARLARAVNVPSAEGTPPVPEGERATEPCTPARAALSADQVALPYEGQGHSLAVPVQFGETELTMLFDTGATVTTLSRAGLARLGIRVPDDAPEITLRTANGERAARLVLVPRVWVGGLPVDGVTVGVCDECEDERTAGLLGLNVSGQFLVTVDTARKEVIFQARQGAQDRVVDVGPWLKVKATARVWPDERVEVEVSADNRSSRPVTEAQVGIHCGSESFVARLRDLVPRSVGTTTLRLPAGTNCEAYTVSLDHAAW
jgi:clan AA aspartic protease (TIGR02281 family)